jgi:hypothetical protein
LTAILKDQLLCIIKKVARFQTPGNNEDALPIGLQEW